MSNEFPLKAGDTAAVVQLSPCVGGLLKTCTSEGVGQLWSVEDSDWLRDTQGVGQIARTTQINQRFREVGMLQSESGSLIIQSRYPAEIDDENYQVEARVVQLSPATQANDSVLDDLRGQIASAVEYCCITGEYLVVELLGWDAPEVPYCLFMLDLEKPDSEQPVSVLETSPAVDSEYWGPPSDPNAAGQTLRATANDDTLGVVPFLMIEAINSWCSGGSGLTPWDVAFTFGKRW